MPCLGLPAPADVGAGRLADWLVSRAKHLSDLRNIDYPDVTADNFTIPQIQVIATRYSRGPDKSLRQIMKNLDYGVDLIEHWNHVASLLGQ